MVQPIQFGLYNICNRRNGGIESALCGMYQANVNLGVFQDMKVTWGVGVYTR